MTASSSSPAEAGKGGDDEPIGPRRKSAENRGAESADNRGAAIDIVLQDDEDLRQQAYGGIRSSPGFAPAEPGAGNAEDEGDEALEASLGGDLMSQGDAPGLGELAEEAR